MARPRTRQSLKPITTPTQTNESVVGDIVEEVEKVAEDSEHFDEDCSLNDYLKVAESEKILDNVEQNAELETLKAENIRLSEENRNLNRELIKIKCELGKIKSETANVVENDIPNVEISELNAKLKVFENQNDDLILRNSELEYDIARLTQTVKILQSEKDKKLHTHTPNGYTPQQKTNPLIKPTYRQGHNGYQDWI